MFLIASAFAQSAGPIASGGGGFDFKGLIPFGLIIVVMYLFILRPQQKKMKQHQALIANVRRGDRILTAGGLIGVVHKVINDQEISLELDEGFRVRVVKTAISQVLAKTEPLKAVEENAEDSSNLKAGDNPTVVKSGKRASKAKNLPKIQG